ncbi:MAG: Txe/YoeB family addiction module toxin [Propionibacteriaceae bacterium]|jgi:toxin YoeB|nr:Txe/YoeB family addiction module toxin [Propionibacteriaceae bacterium]
MRIVWHETAWEDYLWWQRHDRRLLQRINRLITEASRDPEAGIGKPERLAHNLSGCWSRRIDDEHRLVYRWTSDSLEIVLCRYHYGD